MTSRGSPTMFSPSDEPLLTIPIWLNSIYPSHYLTYPSCPICITISTQLFLPFSLQVSYMLYSKTRKRNETTVITIIQVEIQNGRVWNKWNVTNYKGG